jgi:hypothetical protein
MWRLTIKEDDRVAFEGAAPRPNGHREDFDNRQLIFSYWSRLISRLAGPLSQIALRFAVPLRMPLPASPAGVRPSFIGQLPPLYSVFDPPTFGRARRDIEQQRPARLRHRPPGHYRKRVVFWAGTDHAVKRWRSLRFERCLRFPFEGANHNWLAICRKEIRRGTPEVS